jgi:aryl carrier-like protein
VTVPAGAAEDPAAVDPAVTLLGILRDQLEVPELDADDTFYAVGGDSLIAVRVVAEAREKGLRLTLRDLLVHGSVSAIAAHVNLAATPAENWAAPEAFALLAQEDRAKIPPGVEDVMPASALQSGMLYLCAAGGNPTLYHIADGWEVTAPFHEELFRGALVALSRRHPALRASFDVSRFSEPVQMVWRKAEIPLTVDYADAAEEANDRQDDWLGHGAGLPFDSQTSPLIRCHVVTWPGSFRICLVTHHAILDGWSMSRVTVDLMNLYHRALGLGSRSMPEPPRSAHHELITAERAALSCATAQEHWVGQASVPPLLLPGQRAKIPDPSGNLAFPLDTVLVKALVEAAHQLGFSLKSVTLAAHVRALAGWTGRERDVVTGLTFATRPTRAGSDLAAGLFLNTLPVRVPETAGSWSRLVETVAAAEYAGVPHQAFPQARIVELLGRPAFDVNFNFMNFHAYQELSKLAELPVRDWWRSGGVSFPMHVNVQISGYVGEVRIGFDSALLPRDGVRHYATLFERALTSLGADPGASAPPTLRAARA